ncbi:hypothetical protein RCL1_007697 [Eukaryota sp. TZLM3-RCL]
MDLLAQLSQIDDDVPPLVSSNMSTSSDLSPFTSPPKAPTPILPPSKPALLPTFGSRSSTFGSSSTPSLSKPIPFKYPIPNTNFAIDVISLQLSEHEIKRRLSCIILTPTLLSKQSPATSPNDTSSLVGILASGNIPLTSKSNTPYMKLSITDFASSVDVLAFNSELIHKLVKIPLLSTVIIFGLKHSPPKPDCRPSFILNFGENIFNLGMTRNCGFCKAKTKSQNDCRNVVDLSSSTYCSYHQMSIDSQERKSIKKDLKLAESNVINAKAAFRTPIKIEKLPENIGNLAKSLGKNANPAKNVNQNLEHSPFFNDSVVSRRTLSNHFVKVEHEQLSSIANKNTSTGGVSQSKNGGSKVGNHFSPFGTMTPKSAPFGTISQTKVVRKYSESAERGEQDEDKNGVHLINQMLSPSTSSNFYDKISAQPRRSSAVPEELVREIKKKNMSSGVEVIDPFSPPKSKLTKEAYNARFEGQKSELGTMTREEINQILAQKSSRHEQLKKIEEMTMNAYLDKLEKKEQLDLKLASVFSVDVTATYCNTCKAYVVSLEHCRKEQHFLGEKVKSKRFFIACMTCGRHSTSIKGNRVPPCTTCGGSAWKMRPMKEA